MSDVKLPFILAAVGGAIGSLLIIGASNPSPAADLDAQPVSDTVVAIEQDPEPAQTTPQVEPTPQIEDGWVLDIPSIGLHQKMTEVYMQGVNIPTPNKDVGFLRYKTGNIFILGHRNGVFNRLGEIPQQITITVDGEPTNYDLQRYESLPVEQISMNKVLSYQGISMMTCDGENNNGSYTHRLILYYK